MALSRGWFAACLWTPLLLAFLARAQLVMEETTTTEEIPKEVSFFLGRTETLVARGMLQVILGELVLEGGSTEPDEDLVRIERPLRFALQNHTNGLVNIAEIVANTVNQTGGGTMQVIVVRYRLLPMYGEAERVHEFMKEGTMLDAKIWDTFERTCDEMGVQWERRGWYISPSLTGAQLIVAEASYPASFSLTYPPSSTAVTTTGIVTTTTRPFFTTTKQTTSTSTKKRLRGTTKDPFAQQADCDDFEVSGYSLRNNIATFSFCKPIALPQGKHLRLESLQVNGTGAATVQISLDTFKASILDSSSLRVDLEGHLEPGTHFLIILPEGTVQDLAGNGCKEYQSPVHSIGVDIQVAPPVVPVKKDTLNENDDDDHTQLVAILVPVAIGYCCLCGLFIYRAMFRASNDEIQPVEKTHQEQRGSVRHFTCSEDLETITRTMDLLSPRLSFEKRRSLEFDENAFWSSLDMSPTFRSKKRTKLAFQDDGENARPGRSRFLSAIAALSPRLSPRFSPRSVRKKGKSGRGSPSRSLSLNSLSPRMSVRGLRRLKSSRVQPIENDASGEVQKPTGGYSSEGSQRSGGSQRRASGEIQRRRGEYASEGLQRLGSLPKRHPRRRGTTDLRSDEPPMRVSSLRDLGAAQERQPEGDQATTGLQLPIPRRQPSGRRIGDAKLVRSDKFAKAERRNTIG